jgi:glycosyl transferase, family 25
MRFVDFFDCAYVINLAHRQDRREETVRELAEVKIDLQPGKVEFFPAIRPTDPGHFPRLGFRGIALSQLAVLKQAKARGLKNVLILEDDLEFHPDFLQYESAIVTQLAEMDWDVVQLGYCTSALPKGVDLTAQSGSDTQFLHDCDAEIIGCQLFAVNAKAFDLLIDFLEGLDSRPVGHPEGGGMSVDGGYNLLKRRKPEFQRLVSVPSLAEQRSSPSDITPQWYDKMPVVSSLAAFSRTYNLGRRLKAIPKLAGI